MNFRPMHNSSCELTDHVSHASSRFPRPFIFGQELEKVKKTLGFSKKNVYNVVVIAGAAGWTCFLQCFTSGVCS